MTQLGLAKEANVVGPSISRYEEGVYPLPAFYVIERLLAALGYELHIRKKGS